MIDIMSLFKGVSLQETKKKILTSSLYAISLHIFILSIWYINIHHTMVVQLHLLTNTFIFLHISLCILVMGTTTYCAYRYYKTKDTYYRILIILLALITSIALYFTIKNMTNPSLIVFPNSVPTILFFHYLFTLTMYEGLALCILLMATIALLVYTMQDSHKHKYV